MTRRIALLLSFILVPACDLVPVPGPDTDADVATSGAGSTSGGDEPGFVCEDVGAPCDLDAPTCSAGLDCVPRGDDPNAGVCAQRCNLDDGVNGASCAVGWCDIAADQRFGMCRDDDGLPTGLCDGVPSCAGDPCEGGCANGLSCIAGACAFACETAADCNDGEVCLAGACFADGGLADPCN